MKKKFTYKIITLILAIAILFSSCASSTLIQSYPSDARVYVDGEFVGHTPYWYSDTKIMGSITNIDLVKDGYEPLYTSIQRAERIDVAALVGGFYLLAPFLWSLRYAPVHNYELFPLPQQQVPEAIIAPPSNEQFQTNESVQQPQIEAVSPKIQKLRELKQMLDEKLISKDDFEKQKQKILDEK
ncbi:MAG TPA: PEGA domain-containing protein [Paludibacter sp.]|nr:PEGA domain-containing protein [Paludibacter sp.]